MAKNDYSDLDKDDLLKVIEKLKSRKKFGLVWDEKKTKEQFEKDSENALPVLKEAKDKEIKTDPEKPTNILIEGDNYHALSVLNYTHRGKIDVIYIDPPYNTGARDWKYNNDYVDKTDTFRHSKWLSMMKKRLELAKSLLTDDGVLICTIDKNEQANLGVLLQMLFEGREIVCVTIIHNPGGIQGNNFSHTNEFAYFIHPRGGRFISTVNREETPKTAFRDWGKENSKREYSANCFYPVLVRDDDVIGFGEIAPDDFHPQTSNIRRDDGTIEVYPIDSSGVERRWRFSRESVNDIKDELICTKKGNEYSIVRKKLAYRWKTVWTESKYNANVYGTKLLNGIIGEKFDYPKSLYAVIDCIKAVIHDKNNATILDFFAGSGTTAHAVLELNREDGGNRKFILCTNNEGNIATDVCYPRVEKVINGYAFTGTERTELYSTPIKNYTELKKLDMDKVKSIKAQFGAKVEVEDGVVRVVSETKIKDRKAGLGGNLKYFRTAFVKKDDSEDDLKLRITQECTEMLCLREGIFDEIVSGADYKIFAQNGRSMAVFYALARDGLVSLKSDFDRLTGDKILYCFTLDPLGLDAEDFADWQGVRLEPIPQKILDVYKQIYEH